MCLCCMGADTGGGQKRALTLLSWRYTSCEPHNRDAGDGTPILFRAVREPSEPSLKSHWLFFPIPVLPKL